MVAGRVAKVEELAGGVAAANGSVVGVMAGVPVEVLVIAAVPDLTAALMPVAGKLEIMLINCSEEGLAILLRSCGLKTKFLYPGAIRSFTAVENRLANL